MLFAPVIWISGSRGRLAATVKRDLLDFKRLKSTDNIRAGSGGGAARLGGSAGSAGSANVATTIGGLAGKPEPGSKVTTSRSPTDVRW